MIKLAIVVPCYNEEEVLPDSAKRLNEFLRKMIENNKISQDSFVFFVDDGSSDGTWPVIEGLHEADKIYKGLKLAGNVGHQNALLAGLMSVKDEVDAAVSIDADLQDDVDVIEEMLDQYETGCEIVFGVRSDRSSDSVFKRTTAQGFYKTMKLMGAKSVYNHADFRLMGKEALAGLSEYEERNLFLRGIVSQMGYNTGCVYYERKKRLAGESKYPFKKMVRFAVDGITSFSIKPIDFIMYIGFAMVILAIIMAIYALRSYIIGKVVGGWTSLMLSLWFIGGLVLISLGIVGQYIGKIYLEVKRRPRYIIEKRID